MPQDVAWKASETSQFCAIYRFGVAVLCSALLLPHRVFAASSIQSVSGTLYAENFTYYKTSEKGWLRLELFSLKGDVDLYVSGLTLSPSFFEYELKSDSCGVDVVDIHSLVNRPIGIALYAHPFYVRSAYRLDIYVVQEKEVDEYERLFQTYHRFDDSIYDSDYSKDGSKKSRSGKSSEEEESLWWTILINILKFLLEVIM